VLRSGRREPGVAGVGVDDHEEAPVTRGRAEHGAQRVLARVVDGARREPGVHVGVVRRRVGPVLDGGGDPTLAVGVVDRGVQLQGHALAQPVLQHPGHLAHVLDRPGLGLHEAGLRDDGQPLLDRDLQLVQDLHGTGDHVAQDVGRRVVGLDVVGRREEEPLQLSVGVGGQAQGCGVGRRGPDLLDRPAGLLRDADQGPFDGEPFGQRHPGQQPRHRVQQQVEGGLTAHLLPHPVDARLDAHGRRVGLGGVDEGPDGRDDVGVDQRAADVAEGVAVLDPDLDLAGALTGVVLRGGVDQLDEPLAADDDADHEAGQHQQGQHDRDRIAAPPAPSAARVVRLDGDVLAEGLVVHEGVLVQA
jgi:hypothetical protein